MALVSGRAPQANRGDSHASFDTPARARPARRRGRRPTAVDRAAPGAGAAAAVVGPAVEAAAGLAGAGHAHQGHRRRAGALPQIVRCRVPPDGRPPADQNPAGRHVRPHADCRRSVARRSHRPGPGHCRRRAVERAAGDRAADRERGRPRSRSGGVADGARSAAPAPYARAQRTARRAAVGRGPGWRRCGGDRAG